LKSKKKSKQEPERIIENITEAKAAATEEANATTSTTTPSYPKTTIQKARYDRNRLYLVIDDDMAKHLWVKDGDSSCVEIVQIPVAGGVFMTKHYRFAPPQKL
jgi:hypothetical protein